MRMKYINAVILIILCTIPNLVAQKVHTIKVATVAPEGSSWMRQFRQFEKEVDVLTNDQVKFRVYASGVQGGEKDILRKMQLGQLDVGTFTGVGLGEIVPEVRVFDLPFLFRNSAEVDYVCDALFDEFQTKFLEKGFFLAGWAEVGFVYLFTNTPVTRLADFKNVKMWLWKGDPLAKATFDEMKIAAIPLDITDVHTGLQTGLIDGVYISPYGALAMQWHTKTKYMLNYPLTNSIGAILITTKKMNTIPEDLRNILIKKTKENTRQIVLAGRQENLESIQILKENGMQLTNLKSDAAAEFIEAGVRTRDRLAGVLYSREMLDRVLALLDEYRAEHAE
ncbi:MAG TPA: TRAP transporter substrate-binding protein DctP [Candidatus Marinimicrobia bacterium]|nr:TRAP transporter substrate-binding protein DctP [Candidatus Neomarinimicrobiota bacterium]